MFKVTHVSMAAMAALCFVGSASADCSVADSSKVDCGFVGVDQGGCEAKGCCWSPAGQGSVTPWCFYSSSYSSECFVLGNSTTSPFSSQEVSTMRNYFMANINVQGSGSVVASPDRNTPGGSYYWHWERDGALTMRALQEVTADKSSIVEELKSYGKWVAKVQMDADPHGQDVRTEPKYTIPDGAVYDGAWCRPQNDGPGLRAIANMMSADVLEAHGESAFVSSVLWTGSSASNGGTIKYDLDYIVDGWSSDTCDLWEEVRSSDFFWNRATMKKAMLMGAKYAAKKGDSATAARYSDTAAKLSSALTNHWNGAYIYESTGRPKDGAVIVGFNTAYESSDPNAFPPTSYQVASTVKVYNEAFCSEYAVNQADSAAGVPGVLYGRYPGDTYAGGNPWVLTTAALGQLFYRAAKFTLENGMPEASAMPVWASALGLNSMPSSQHEVADTFFRAGDSVMLRLRNHVQADGGHLAEQIDRNSGKQTSAADLTWSYAEVLNAMQKRGEYVAVATGNAETA